MINIKVIKTDDKDTDKVAKAIIIDENRNVLLLKRSNYLEKYANEWDLPGGHLKVGETLEQGLIREVKEETGLNIKDANYFSNIEEHLYFFTVQFTQEEIILSEEHVEYKFFKQEELNKKEKFQNIALKALRDKL